MDRRGGSREEERGTKVGEKSFNGLRFCAMSWRWRAVELGGGTDRVNTEPEDCQWRAHSILETAHSQDFELLFLVGTTEVALGEAFL